MKISVLISTYNGEKFIQKQLESIVNQTRIPDEVVILDDCSSDNTNRIISSFIEQHKNCNWIYDRNEKNKGWKKNFIEGITVTSGDIVFFCDQDDVWYSDKIEAYEKLFDTNPLINVLTSKEEYWNGAPIIGDRSVNIDIIRVIDLAESKKDYFIRSAGCVMAFRRPYFDKIRKYYVEGWAHDDYFWKMAICDKSLGFIESNSILHRIHPNNESRKKRDKSGTLLGLTEDLDICEKLLLRLEDEQVLRRNDKISFVMHKKKGTNLRIKFFETKNPIYLLRIVIAYSDLYRRKRQIIGDFLLAYNIM